MNRQELIEEYKDYGYKNAEIAEMLDIELLLVKDALIKPKRLKTEKRAKAVGGLYKNKRFKSFATDRDNIAHELLYEYTPKELNKMLKNYGLRPTVKFISTTRSAILTLKGYFGYRHPIPGNARELTSYFSSDLRKQIDARDNRECQRCNRVQDSKNIRYHKISHPALCTVDNCITLCNYCRTHRMLKHIRNDIELFNTMDYTSIKEWITANDPFVVRNRVYPKGQIGTWKK